MDWSQRAFVKIIKEIADEENIELSLYSEGWAQKLTKNNKTAFIYGYKFPNNSASSEQVCNDKPCVSEILESKNIRCKFYPTCSEYTRQAIKKYGVIKGCILGCARILKCNPFSKGGYDPLK